MVTDASRCTFVGGQGEGRYTLPEISEISDLEFGNGISFNLSDILYKFIHGTRIPH